MKNSRSNWIVLFTVFAVIAIGYLSYQGRNRTCETLPEAHLIVGTNATYPPFSFIENGVIVGYDIDVITEVARRIDKQIILKDLSFDALIPEIQLGSIHVIASDLTPTPERSKQVLFSELYFSGDPLVIISRNNNPLMTLDELKNKNVIVNQGYYSDAYISEKMPTLPITRLETFSEAILALNSERADAFITGKASFERFFATNPHYKFHQAVIPNAAEQYALAVSKKHEHLLQSINKALENMNADGALLSLQKKWNIA